MWDIGLTDMKKLIMLLFCFFYVLPLIGQSRITYDPYSIKKKNIVKINLLSGFIGTINLSYETKISNNWSVQGNFAYTNLNIDASARKRTSLIGFQTGIDLRKYLRQKNEWNGSYTQLMLRYNDYQHHYFIQDSSTNNVVVNYKENLKGVSVGFIMGYQRTFKNKFVIDAFAGVFNSFPILYNSTPTKVKIDMPNVSFETNPYTNGGSIRIGLKVGYLF